MMWHVLRRIRWSVMILGLILLLAGGVAAQGTAYTRVYEAPDASFAFTFPRDWQLITNRGLVYVAGDGITVSVVGPTVLEDVGLADVSNPQLLVATLRAQFGLGDGTLITLDLNDRPAARLDAPNRQGYPGFLVVVTLSDGRPAVVDVRFTSPQQMRSESAVLALVQSLDVPVGLPPATLTAALNSPLAIRAELQDAGVIPNGTLPIFIEADSFRQGQRDALFVALGNTDPAQDVLLGGTLTFTGGTQVDEVCTLGLRIQSDAQDVVTSYLEVGFTGNGEFYYLDYTGNPETSHTRTSLRPVTNDSHHIVLVALHNTLTVYLDGELLFDRVPVTARVGTYGIGLLSGRTRARCEGTDIWAYEIPSYGPGTCLISSDMGVNRRVGPGIDFAAVAVLRPRETSRAVARGFSTQGELWWALVDGTYVSAEVVTTAGYCSNLPER